MVLCAIISRYGAARHLRTPSIQRLGRDHGLALSRCKGGWHQARALAAFVDEPERVTRRQINAWAGDFDN